MSDPAGMRMEEKHSPIYLPIHLVENILVRLPVKSLLRLKAVSKQWSATISDPNFIHTHLQQSQKSLCSYIHLRTHSLTRLSLENNEFQEFPPMDYRQLGIPYGFGFVWCYCDGLYVVSSFYHSSRVYAVWNPSCRTYKALRYPYAADPSSYLRRYLKVIVGIWYNPVVKDYKVVFVETEHHAVFSCKDNSWIKKRTNSISLDNSISLTGVPYKESIYWFQINPSPNLKIEIVCFDGREEKFKIICNDLDYADHFNDLFTSQNGLFLVSRRKTWSSEIVIEQILPERTDQHKLQLSYFRFKPLCFTQQDKLILILQLYNGEEKCIIYDCSGRCFAETNFKPALNFFEVSHFNVYSYAENLFLH